MSDSNEVNAANSQTTEQSSQDVPHANNDRTDLLQTARAFLNSPQVRYEDAAAKRNFLTQKGLSDAEVEQLLRELPAQAPLIPPRTYPQLPQSSLPNLLLGIFRIATWIAGGSAALILAYFRFIYPRVAQSYQARHALHTHQKSLLSRLTKSIEETKAEQAATFALLPRPEPYKEDETYARYKTLGDIVTSAKEPRNVPHITVLRCAIQGLAMTNQKTTTEAIFKQLEEKLPWTRPDEEPELQTQLWETLSSCPLFEQTEIDGEPVWQYHSPTPPPTPPVLSSLSRLQTVLPSGDVPRPRLQNTLQSLTDLTGYIASQTYSIPKSFRYTATGLASNLTPEEEEIRKEIRMLKGLVLNRRSFLPPRPTIPTPTNQTPSTP